MNRLWTTSQLLVVLALSAIAAAQQPNTSSASFTVNAINGPAYPIVMTIETNALASALIQGNPNAPYLIASSFNGGVRNNGGIAYGGQVNIPLVPFPQIVVDGFVAGSPFHTDSLGNGSLSTSFPPSAVGAPIGLQALVADPFSPHGATLTAAVGLTVQQNWASQMFTLGDEAVLPLPTGSLQIPFFGTSNNHFYVGSNGYITFGAPDGSDYTPTPTELAAGPSRIAGFWCDLECGLNAVKVTAKQPTTPNSPGFLRVDYNNVNDYTTTNSHTFSMQVYENGLIQIIHSNNPGASIYEMLVGISPGLGGSSAPQKNLSAISMTGSYLGGVNEQIYEWFGIVTQNPFYTAGFDNPYDLAGRVITFAPIGAGSLPGSTNRYLVY